MFERERDNQRSKVYAAERILDTRTFLEEIPDFKDCEKLINKITKSRYVQNKYPRVPEKVDVIAKRSGGWSFANSSRNYIKLSKYGQRNWIVIHEVAHIVSKRTYGIHIAGHGWQFAKVYLDLVRHFMGKDAHAALKESFKSHRVRTRQKKKRILTDEQKEQLRQRMAYARSCKT